MRWYRLMLGFFEVSYERKLQFPKVLLLALHTGGINKTFNSVFKFAAIFQWLFQIYQFTNLQFQVGHHLVKFYQNAS